MGFWNKKYWLRTWIKYVQQCVFVYFGCIYTDLNQHEAWTINHIPTLAASHKTKVCQRGMWVTLLHRNYGTKCCNLQTEGLAFSRWICRIYGTDPFCPKTAFQKCRWNCGKKTSGVFSILSRYLYVGIYLSSLLKQCLNHIFRWKSRNAKDKTLSGQHQSQTLNDEKRFRLS